jgi:hypothetical protein
MIFDDLENGTGLYLHSDISVAIMSAIFVVHVYLVENAANIQIPLHYETHVLNTYQIIEKSLNL